MSCAIEILSFQNFYKVLKTCSARRKDFFDTLISVWAGDKSRHFAQLSHASQNPGRYWYRSSNAWSEILASANVLKIYTFTKIAHLQFIAGLHLPLEARILMKAGGGACIGSAGVDACSFLLPHHVFSKYSLYPRRKLLRKATSLETRNQKFFAQKEKEFKQKPEFLNFLSGGFNSDIFVLEALHRNGFEFSIEFRMRLFQIFSDAIRTPVRIQHRLYSSSF